MTRTADILRRLAVVALTGIGMLVAVVLFSAAAESVVAASQPTALEALTDQAVVTGNVLSVESEITVLRGTGLIMGVAVGIAVGSVLTFTRLSR